MAQNPTPRKLSIHCPRNCSFHPDTIGTGNAEALKAVRESGHGARVFMREFVRIVGRETNMTSVSRHMHHYRELEAETEQAGPQAKVSDLEMLNGIIAAGFRNSKNWKPTIGDTLKAMEMKLKLTGNSAFEDMLGAMAVASANDEPIEDDGENPAAKDEPLEEPVF